MDVQSLSRVALKGEELDFNALETSRGKVNTEFSEIHRWIRTRKSGVLDVHRHQGRPGSPVTPPGTPNDGDLAAEVNRRRDGDDEGEEAEVKKTESRTESIDVRTSATCHNRTLHEAGLTGDQQPCRLPPVRRAPNAARSLRLHTHRSPSRRKPRTRSGKDYSACDFDEDEFPQLTQACRRDDRDP